MDIVRPMHGSVSVWIWWWLTGASAHAAGDLHQDAGVAEDHDDQGQQEETHEGEQVVDGLLPVLDEAPAGGALGEALWDRDGHVVEDEHLHRDQWTGTGKRSALWRHNRDPLEPLTKRSGWPFPSGQSSS